MYYVLGKKGSDLFNKKKKRGSDLDSVLGKPRPSLVRAKSKIKSNTGNLRRSTYP